MRDRRYTVLIADGSTGVLRRLTFSPLPFVAIVVSALALPVLIGLGAKRTHAEIGASRSTITYNNLMALRGVQGIRLVG